MSATDYMDEAAPDVAGSEDKKGKPSEDGPDTGNALIAKDFFHGKELKPGGRCTIEIVHVFDDEVEAKYVPHDAKEAEESETEGEAEPADEMME